MPLYLEGISSLNHNGVSNADASMKSTKAQEMVGFDGYEGPENGLKAKNAILITKRFTRGGMARVTGTVCRDNPQKSTIAWMKFDSKRGEYVYLSRGDTRFDVYRKGKLISVSTDDTYLEDMKPYLPPKAIQLASETDAEVLSHFIIHDKQPAFERAVAELIGIGARSRRLIYQKKAIERICDLLAMFEANEEEKRDRFIKKCLAEAKQYRNSKGRSYSPTLLTWILTRIPHVMTKSLDGLGRGERIEAKRFPAEEGDIPMIYTDGAVDNLVYPVQIEEIIRARIVSLVHQFGPDIDSKTLTIAITQDVCHTAKKNCRKPDDITMLAGHVVRKEAT